MLHPYPYIALSFGIGLSCAAAPLIAVAQTSQQEQTTNSIPGSDRQPEEEAQVFHEDWSSGTIDPEKWYSPNRHWGQGNNGVVETNVFLEEDEVNGTIQHVLVLEGHGDRYTGEVTGRDGNAARVGGILVSKQFFASGEYEAVLRIGERQAHEGGPADPHRPAGMCPALWTYAYRWVQTEEGQGGAFQRGNPIYHPTLDPHGWGGAEYWSEIDFPEFGSQGDFDIGLYNTFLNRNHNSRKFDTSMVMDGEYHTITMRWHTEMREIEVSDEQVAEEEGFYWVQDPTVGFGLYRANPLKKLGTDRYAVYAGKEIVYLIDGQEVGRSTSFVPSMAAQLTLGVWFPEWVGEADWAVSKMRIASVTITPFNDPGDCHGFLTEDLPENIETDD